jgi:hypothetical protein
MVARVPMTHEAPTNATVGAIIVAVPSRNVTLQIEGSELLPPRRSLRHVVSLRVGVGQCVPLN